MKPRLSSPPTLQAISPTLALGAIPELSANSASTAWAELMDLWDLRNIRLQGEAKTCVL